MARPRAAESDAVLDAAVRRLVSDGISGTTVDDVAAEAGVSRATVYRYLGGKSDIVQAAILGEADAILERVAAAVVAAPTAADAIADGVAATLAGVANSDLLARLTTTDLTDSLPHLTVDSGPLVSAAVPVLESAFREAPMFDVADDALDVVIEEAARFVLAHLTTPRRDGSTLTPVDAGRRAARLLTPFLAGS